MERSKLFIQQQQLDQQLTVSETAAPAEAMPSFQSSARRQRVAFHGGVAKLLTDPFRF